MTKYISEQQQNYLIFEYTLQTSWSNSTGEKLRENSSFQSGKQVEDLQDLEVGTLQTLHYSMSNSASQNASNKSFIVGYQYALNNHKHLTITKAPAATQVKAN
jgi:hypothetical protein